MTKTPGSDRFDALLSGLEDAVLAGDGQELLAESAAEATETAMFIARRLASGRAAQPLPSLTPRRRSQRRIPRDPAARRRLLAQLIAVRPELPKRISLAFEAREPNDDELAQLLEELLGMPEDRGSQ